MATDMNAVMQALSQLQAEVQMLRSENQEIKNRNVQNELDEEMDGVVDDQGEIQEELNWCDVLPSSKLTPSVPAAKLLSSLLEKPPPFALVKSAETEDKI